MSEDINNKKDHHSSRKDDFLGKHFFTKYGSEFVVIDYRDASYLTIQFLDDPNIIRPSCVKKIEHNSVPDPFYDREGNRKEVVFNDPHEYYEGRIFTTHTGYQVQIDKYHDARHLDYHFVEYPDAKGNTSVNILKNTKNIKCPYQPNYCGGYLGVGPYDTYDISFGVWRKVIERANNHELHNQKLKQSGHSVGAYDNCILDPEWLNFQNFAVFYHSVYDYLNPNYRYQIDKDLYYPYYKDFYNGYHCYSKYTCTLLPEELNKALVIPKLYRENFTEEKHKKYKVEKEQRIKMLTKFYYNEGALPGPAIIVLERFNVDLYL